MTLPTRLATLLALVSLLATGCLLKHDTHTWYLEPDTAVVVWTVSEQDVRSDASAAMDRQNEELAWWNDVQAARHPMARGLIRLGALNPEVRVLRDRPPFHVVTEGTFQSIDELGRQIILTAGLSGTSLLTRDGDRAIWTLNARDPRATEMPLDDDVSELVGGLADLRVVLTTGRFESSRGFHLEQDRRVAVVEKPEDEADTLVLQLVWTAAVRVP